MVFATLDELRVLGPLWMREMLKHRPPRRLGMGRRGQVLEFAGAHHTAGSRDSDGGGS